MSTGRICLIFSCPGGRGAWLLQGVFRKGHCLCGGKWLMAQSGEVMPSVQGGSTVTCFEQKLSILCSGLSFLIVLPMNVLNLGYPWLQFVWVPVILCMVLTYLFLPANYDDLYQWSVESYSDFWAEFWKYSNIVCSRLYDEVSSAQCLSAQRHPERKSTDVTISLLPSS